MVYVESPRVRWPAPAVTGPAADAGFASGRRPRVCSPTGWLTTTMLRHAPRPPGTTCASASLCANPH